MVDQLAEPHKYRVGFEWSLGHLRGTEARQVVCDHMVGAHQIGDDGHPRGSEVTLPVQEHDRRSLPALKQRGGDPCNLEPALGDRQILQES